MIEFDEKKWREDDPRRFRTDVVFAPDPRTLKRLERRSEALRRLGKRFDVRETK